jgi:hypothetical protein
MSQFGDFISDHSIQPEQIVAQSTVMEKIDDEVRTLRNKRAEARRAKKSYAEFEAPKPKALGRGVSKRIVSAAIEGRPLTRMNRQKLVRALNAILAHEKKDPVDVGLFSDAPRKVKKS